MMNQFFGRVKHPGPKDLVLPLPPGRGLRCLAPREGKAGVSPRIILGAKFLSRFFLQLLLDQGVESGHNTFREEYHENNY